MADDKIREPEEKNVTFMSIAVKERGSSCPEKRKPSKKKRRASLIAVEGKEATRVVRGKCPIVQIR